MGTDDSHHWIFNGLIFYPLYYHEIVVNPLIHFNGPLVLSLLMGAYPKKSYP